MKRGGLGIPDPRLSDEHTHNTSKAARDVLAGSLLGGTDLNYVEHKYFLRRLSVDARKYQEYSNIEALTRRKELADGAGLNRLRRATEKEEWLTAIPQHL